MAQFGVGLHPGRTSLLAPVGALLVTACGGGLVVAVLGQLVPRTQRAVRSRIAKRRKLRTAASAEVRRVWAPTIGEALDAMVADRRTDETLQQIEQAAHADGALWPDA